MRDLLIFALAVVAVVAAIVANEYLAWRAWDDERRWQRRLWLRTLKMRAATREVHRFTRAMQGIGISAQDAARAMRQFARHFGPPIGD